MKLTPLYLGLVFIVGCASTHPGTIAKNTSPVQNGLIVSADVVREYSDKYNFFIDVTFENPTGTWLRVDSVDLDFSNSQDAAHNVIVGQDLHAWAESFSERKKIEDYNTSIAINAMIITGAVLATNSKSSSQTNTGAALMMGGTAWDATKSTIDARNNAQRSESVPEKHIYRPFTVPAAGLIRRWLIVSVPGQYIVKNFKLKMKTVEGKELDYLIPVRL